MGVLTLLRDQFVALPRQLVVTENVKFMSFLRDFSLFLSLSRHDFSFAQADSQSSTLAIAIKKFMTFILWSFHCLFFKMHVKQTPQKSDLLLSVLLDHIVYNLDGRNCNLQVLQDFLRALDTAK